MAEAGVLIGMYDAPQGEDFDAWLHGPYYQAILKMPGVRSIQRLEVIDPPPEHQRYVVLIETEDIAATLRHRDSDDWRHWQQEAAQKGLINRKLVPGKRIVKLSTEGSETAGR